MVTTYSAEGRHRSALCVTTACSTSSVPTASEPVIISPLAGHPKGEAAPMDGMAAFVSGQGQRERFDVPALGVSLETYGTLGHQIATTMAPSPALVVASATTATPTPGDGRVVHYSGVTLSIPNTWPNVFLRALPTSWQRTTSGACDLFLAPGLYLGDPQASAAQQPRTTTRPPSGSARTP